MDEYQYQGKNKNKEYFRKETWKSWCFDGFRQYLADNSDKVLKTRTTWNLFFKHLHDIKQENIPKQVRQHIDMLLENGTSTTVADSERPAIHLNFNGQGSSLLLHGDNIMNVGSSNDSHARERTPVPEHPYSSPLPAVSNEEQDIMAPVAPEENVDDTPTRLTRLAVETTTVSDDEAESGAKWILRVKNPDFDVSSYLFMYRSQSIIMNREKTHKEQSLSRLLSISHVYFFGAEQSQSCVSRLNEEADEIYEDLYQEYQEEAHLSNDLLSWAAEISKKSNRDEIKQSLFQGEILQKAASTKDILLVNGVRILFDLHTNMQYMKWPARNAEDTFVHEFISPFLRYIFKDKDLGTFWANTSLQSVTPLPLLQAIPETFGACASEASSSISPPAPKRKRSDKMLPDFNCYGYILGRRFDLFIAEIKPPHSSNAVSDLPKLAKAMKRMIDILVAYGIDQPRVCGLWVQGFSCHTYAMDLEYEGIYRMVELDQFHLPRTVADLVLTKHAMECLLKVKGIIIRTLGNINKLNLGNCKQIRSTKPTGVL